MGKRVVVWGLLALALCVVGSPGSAAAKKPRRATGGSFVDRMVAGMYRAIAPQLAEARVRAAPCEPIKPDEGGYFSCPRGTLACSHNILKTISLVTPYTGYVIVETYEPFSGRYATPALARGAPAELVSYTKTTYELAYQGGRWRLTDSSEETNHWQTAYGAWREKALAERHQAKVAAQEAKERAAQEARQKAAEEAELERTALKGPAAARYRELLKRNGVRYVLAMDEGIVVSQNSECYEGRGVVEGLTPTGDGRGFTAQLRLIGAEGSLGVCGDGPVPAVKVGTQVRVLLWPRAKVDGVMALLSEDGYLYESPTDTALAEAEGQLKTGRLDNAISTLEKVTAAGTAEPRVYAMLYRTYREKMVAAKEYPDMERYRALARSSQEKAKRLAAPKVGGGNK